jgi:hypothetical protein
MIVSMLKTVTSRNVAFGILYNRFATNALRTDRAHLFARGLKAALGADGRLTSERVVSLGGYPGREWRIEKDQGETIITMRSYVVGDDVYQAISVMRRDRVCQRHVAEFLDSCRLRSQ